MTTASVPGPAWFRHRMGDGLKVRVFLKGWFTPLQGTVEAVDKNRACIQGRWFTLTGRKCDVHSVEMM